MTSVLWMSAAMAALWSQQPASADPTVQLRVAVYMYKADGSIGGSAGGTVGEGSDAANLVWVAFSSASCGMGAGALPPRQDAIVWKSSGRIVSHTGTDYTIDLDVSRSPGATSEPPVRQRTVALGEHVLLDQVPSVPGPCGGRAARLEATVELAHPPGGDAVRAGARGAASGGLGSASGGSTGPRSTGSGGVGGGSAAAGPQSGWIFRPANPLDGRAMFAATLNPFIGAPIERSVLAAANGVADSSDATPVELRPLSASLLAVMWLVYTTPDGVPHTWSQSGPVDQLGETFGFPPVVVPKGDGSLQQVFVGINLRPMTAPDGRSVLRAAIARIVNGQGVGVSNRAIPMPSKGDVVSFEIPDGAGRQDPASGYHFEVRVRVTPGGTP